MEYDTVRLFYFNFFPIHHNAVIIKINRKECHCIGFMVQADNMFVVWEQCCILGVFATDWQAE